MYDLIKQPHAGAALLIAKTHFAAYAYRNCHPHRESFFDLLNAYKRVDAYGDCKRNVAADSTRSVYTATETHNDLAVQQYRKHKFVIAFENQMLHGYISEKLLSPMMANTIPVYLGASDVAQQFNNRSFIDVQHYNSYADVVAYIRYLDENDAAYVAMIEQPWFNEGNKLSPFFLDPLQPDNHIFRLYQQLPAVMFNDTSLLP